LGQRLNYLRSAVEVVKAGTSQPLLVAEEAVEVKRQLVQQEQHQQELAVARVHQQSQ
jgi:hypothetical protein